MRYEEIEGLRRQHASWRLLTADSSPLVLSFLGRVFVEENRRTVPRTELLAALDEELFAVRARVDESLHPRPAREYLDDWAHPDRGWLRAFYVPGSDEVHYDVTPSVERAVRWVEDLHEQSFVGTESRLNAILDLLRQLVTGSTDDPRVRLSDLQRQRAELDDRIAAAERGELDVLDPAAQRDRYQLLSSTARHLLSDFRQVEENFRDLDRGLRVRIAGWEGTKGELLEIVLGDRGSIDESDQGRAFNAFYDFLLSESRQDEFTRMLGTVQHLPAIEERDERLRTVFRDWLRAAESTQGTVRRLSEQLRHFLDDQVFLENRRVLQTVRHLESLALGLRDHVPAFEVELDDHRVEVGLPMERPLHVVRPDVVVDDAHETADPSEIDAGVLFSQVVVDATQLGQAVREALLRRPEIGLDEVVQGRPLEHGLAELVTYLALPEDGFETVYDEDRRQRIDWLGDDGVVRAASVPAVTFKYAGRSRS